MKTKIKILGSKHNRLCYFDGFAGRGKYEDGSYGSPLIAIDVASKFKNYKDFVCVFIEKNKENF